MKQFLSGPVRHWLVTKFPIPGPDGRPALAGGIAIDVTEQKRAEEELREHAELLDLATDAILVHDPAGALTYWNRGAERLYEWSREEALGRRADALLRTVFPLPREEITAEVARAGHWEGDLTHTRRDGSAVVVASRWTRRLNEGGGLAAILEINTDVTERTQAAELRAQFLARLIAAQEDERGRVARELHDGVAQTLSALHLRVGALTRRPLPAEILGELDELRRAAQAAVEEVRFLARGLRPPVLDELGLLPALTRYAEDFARTHGIRAEVVASGPAGGRLPAEVETALYRIAQEALANVARHSRASAVSVVLLRGPTFVQLLVEDDGAGWDPTSPPADGDAYHHLGLQGMRERAALLGGSLSVESSPGAGTAVCARLPLRGGSMKKVRILLADDHAVLRAGLRALVDAEPDLEVAGEAATVPEAVERVAALGPDVLVLDLHMPGGDGVGVIGLIRATRPDTRVLVLTMHDDAGYARAALAAGASGYVVKSADAAELLAAVRAVHQGRTFVDVGPGAAAAPPPTPPTGPGPVQQTTSPLSEREEQVLRLLADGYTNKQIAEQLDLSVKTVETYRLRVMRKLDLHTRADLVRYLRER